MKILLKKEFQQELENIVTYGDDDLVVVEKDLHSGIENNLIIMGSCKYCGISSLEKVIKLIILDFEKNEFFIKNADTILIYFQVNKNYEIMSFTDEIDMIYGKCESISVKEPDVIWGVSFDDTFEDDCIKATMFASYSKKEKTVYDNNFIEIS